MSFITKLNNFLQKMLCVNIVRCNPDLFLTIHKRPKRARDIMTESKIHVEENVAIILRGQIVSDADFTLETIRLYKKHFPGVKIIISTWNDDGSKAMGKIRNENSIEIVLNEKPAAPMPMKGKHTINLQRVCAQAGLNRAKELGCKYALVTRTDQRMYATDVFPFLIKMLDLFPVTDKTSTGRIIVLSLGTFTRRMYNFSDFWQFGLFRDVYNFWNCPEDTRDFAEIEKKAFTVGIQEEELGKYRLGESYWTTHYIEQLGYQLKMTLEDSNYFLKNFFIVIDKEAVDLFWFKYTHLEYMYKRYTTGGLEEITFKDWVNLL